jgi:hypothetical protein
MSKNPKSSPSHPGHQKEASDKRQVPDGSVQGADPGPARRLPPNVVVPPDDSLDNAHGDDAS